MKTPLSSMRKDNAVGLERHFHACPARAEVLTWRLKYHHTKEEARWRYYHRCLLSACTPCISTTAIMHFCLHFTTGFSVALQSSPSRFSHLCEFTRRTKYCLVTPGRVNSCSSLKGKDAQCGTGFCHPATNVQMKPPSQTTGPWPATGTKGPPAPGFLLGKEPRATAGRTPRS